MSLVACAECDAQISKSAKACPHCGTLSAKSRKLADADTFKCRKCGAALKRSEHVVQRGNNVSQIACPKCGEPKPDKYNTKLAGFLAVFILLGLFILSRFFI